MIAIDIPYREEDSHLIKMDQVPAALQNAISKTFDLYPKIVNNEKTKDMRFDRLFEKLYNCRIEYNENNAVSRIVWDNDHDYTMFLLKWV